MTLKVLAHNPQHLRANCLLSLCHLHLQNFGEALKFAEVAISGAPDEEWGHRLRSIALTELGRKKDAVKAAEEAVRLAPYEPFALQVLASAFLEDRQLRQAQAVAEKMREVAPEMENTFFILGNVAIARRDYHEAENFFRQALRLNPNFADARNNLGIALLRQKENTNSFNKSSNVSIFDLEEKNEIHTHFSEAIRLDPGNQVAAQNLRNQFDYVLGVLGFSFFIPFLVLVLFVAPGWAILIALFGFLSLMMQILEVYRQRRNLTPEIKLFLKTSRKTLRERGAEYLSGCRLLFKKTWKPHLLAILAVCCRFFYGIPKFTSSGWNDYLAYILIIAAAIWLISELRKD